jgi:inorganic triphosphatase YgiF
MDHEEREWQLEVVELALVENWLEEHPSAAGLAIDPATASELSDVYYDTQAWRFYRAGYKLRVRQDGQSARATMKALVPPRMASAGAGRSPSP